MMKLLLIAILLFAFGCSKKIIKEEPMGDWPNEPKTIVQPEQPKTYEMPIIEDDPDYGAYTPGFINIHFDFDMHNINSRARQELFTNFGILQDAGSDRQFVLEGHADERGSSEYNLALGDARIRAVLKYLQNAGLTEYYFRTISYGEERPINPGTDEDSYAENRRVEIKEVQ